MSRRKQEGEKPYAVITVSFMDNENRVTIEGFDRLSKPRIDRAVRALLRQYHIMRSQAVSRDRKERVEEMVDGR